MNSKDKIITSNGNQYLYLGKNGDFHYLSKINYFGIDEKKRYDFWNSHHLLDRCDWNFTADYSSQLLKENLANLRQLLIEVTDGCNLACKYCGYGDLYRILASPCGKREEAVVKKFKQEKMFMIGRCDCVIAIAPHSYEMLRELYGVAEEKLALVSIVAAGRNRALRYSLAAFRKKINEIYDCKG